MTTTVEHAYRRALGRVVIGPVLREARAGFDACATPLQRAAWGDAHPFDVWDEAHARRWLESATNLERATLLRALQDPREAPGREAAQWGRRLSPSGIVAGSQNALVKNPLAFAALGACLGDPDVAACAEATGGGLRATAAAWSVRARLSRTLAPASWRAPLSPELGRAWLVAQRDAALRGAPEWSEAVLEGVASRVRAHVIAAATGGSAAPIRGFCADPLANTPWWPWLDLERLLRPLEVLRVALSCDEGGVAFVLAEPGEVEARWAWWAALHAALDAPVEVGAFPSEDPMSIRAMAGSLAAMSRPSGLPLEKPLVAHFEQDEPPDWYQLMCLAIRPDLASELKDTFENIEDWMAEEAPGGGAAPARAACALVVHEALGGSLGDLRRLWSGVDWPDSLAAALEGLGRPADSLAPAHAGHGLGDAMEEAYGDVHSERDPFSSRG